MAAPTLFLDRDGTLIAEPPDFHIDAFDKLRILPGAIPALAQLAQAGFRFILITNQDGLGHAPHKPLAPWQAVHTWLMQLLADQGVPFLEELIDDHYPHQNHPNRKPNTGLAAPAMQRHNLDPQHTWVVGDRPTDALLAQNLGVHSLTLRHPLSADPAPDTEALAQPPAPTTTFADWHRLAQHLLHAVRP